MGKIAIVILSCFKYRYMWELVLSSWERELKNHYDKFDFYITTDNPKDLDINKFFSCNNVEFLEYESNITWSNALIESLEKLEKKNYKKIITTFDDLLITNINLYLLQVLVGLFKHV